MDEDSPVGEVPIDDEFLAELVRNSPDPYVVIDASFVLRWASTDAVMFVGRTAEQLVGVGALDLVAPHDHATALAAVHEFRRAGELGEGWTGPPIIIDLLHADGRVVPTEVLGVPFPQPDFDGVVARLRPAKDMVALDRAVEALVACDDLDEVLVDIIEVLELQFPASRAAVGLEWDGEGFGRVVGDAGCCTVLTAEATAAHPTLWEELLQAGAPLAVDDPAQLGSAFAAGAASLAAVGCWLFPFVADGSAGALVVWRTLPGPLALHHQRAIERLVRLVQLALTTHRARVALVARSHTDPLTGLANRFGLADRLSELGRQGSEHTVGLLYCDVDDFKPVNDRYGHTTGDHVLEVVARRLAGAARRDDLVARIGGDEFVVVCPGTDQGALDRMAARVRDAFDEPISADGACVDLTVSVGAAVLPEDWGDHPIDTVLDHADQALLQAKARRRRP